MNRLLDLLLVLSLYLPFSIVKFYLVWFRFAWLSRAWRSNDPTMRAILRVGLWPIDLIKHKTLLRTLSLIQVVFATVVVLALLVAVLIRLGIAP